MMDDSNPVNPIIKVIGHHRSGCNYLCALMWKNFYSGLKSTEGMVHRKGRRFILFGEEVEDDPFHHPYVNIFGGHDPSKTTPQSVYILRRWEDVEKSMNTMKHKIPKMYAGDLFTHTLHVYQALRNRPYVVYYEDLVAQPDRVLREIQYHFRLNRLWKVPIVDVGYCGWPE